MRVHRQSIWLCFCLALTGCYGMDPMPLIFDKAPFSHAAQVEGNAHCAPLFGNGQFARLSGKMPVLSRDVPTRAMLTLNTAPDTEDISAIQALEGVARTCRQMREAAGVPTSATEDILAARISKLRFGLYRGDLPYAVYNYGVAQALKSHNNFLLEGEKAASQGRKVGRDKELTGLMLGQFMALNSRLSAYERATARTSWTCLPSGVGTDLDCY